MLAFLLATQIIAGDSAYSSAELRALVDEIARANRVVRPSLANYRARVESEIAVLLRGGGKERVSQVEQVESELRWEQGGTFEQRVIGYRPGTPARSKSSLAVSALSYLRNPWVVPTLSGNRLRVLIRWRDAGTGNNGKTAPIAIHPLSDGRDGVYWFESADTTTLQLPDGRVIPVIRLRVTPRVTPSARALIFRGELDVEVTHKQVIRMRGQFVNVRPHPSLWARLVRKGLRTIAVAELINTEVGEGHWLPAYQRIELQGRSPLSKDFRPILRITSRFQRHSVNDLAHAPCAIAAKRAAECLTVAPRDSLAQFSQWMDEPGAITIASKSSDFDDVTSESWGRSVVKPESKLKQPSDTLQPSRVKRVYAGLSERLRPPAALQGFTVKADAGRVWSEGATRGAVALQWRRAPWRSSLRVERPLLRGAGLLPTLEEQQSVLAFRFGTDVDRRSGTVAWAHELGGARGLLLNVHAAPASDPAEGVWSRSASACAPPDMRASGGAIVGRNLRTAVALDLHPHVTGARRAPGTGAGFTYERVDCQLGRQRIEGRLVARHASGPMIYAGRLDAGAITSWLVRPDDPRQPGAPDGLTTREHFGNRRAALLRLSATYELPRFGSPLRSLRWIYLPSATPAIALNLRSEWTDALTQSLRSTAGVTVHPFGGSFGLGAARSLHHNNWNFVVTTDRRW